MVSAEYSEAIVEILDILKNSDDTIYKRIPNKLIEFWQRNKSTTYKPNLDHSKPLNDMELKEKTRDLITMIYLNYLCDDNEKKAMINILKNNERNYQLELREKYNTDNIFKNRKKEIVVKEETQVLVKYNRITFLQKVLYKIRNLFKRKQ